MSSNGYKYITKKIISRDKTTPSCQQLVLKGIDQQSAKECMDEKLGQEKDPDNLYDNAKELERKMIERAEARKAEAEKIAADRAVRPLRKKEPKPEVASLFDQLAEPLESAKIEENPEEIAKKIWESVKPRLVSYILANPILAGIIGNPDKDDIIKTESVTTPEGEIIRLVVRQRDREEIREIRFKGLKEQRGVRGMLFEISDPGGFKEPDNYGSAAFMDLDSIQK